MSAPAGKRIEVRVGSVDLPGCFAPGAQFSVHVASMWRGMQSFNMMRFNWQPDPASSADPASGASVIVRMEGRGGEKRAAVPIAGETAPTGRLPTRRSRESR